MALLLRLHLLLMAFFACLSADASLSLGIETLRIILFVALAGSLSCIAIAYHPFFSNRLKTAPAVIVILLVLGMSLDPAAALDPLDYRLILPLILIGLAPNIARLSATVRLERDILLALFVYVGLSFILLPYASSKGGGGPERVDIFGSLVTHSAIATIAFIASLAALLDARTAATRIGLAGLALAAAILVVLSGTRTPLLTLAIAASLAAGFGGLRLRASHLLVLLVSIVMIVGAVVASGAAHNFIARLAGSGLEDYSSGRWWSQAWWLEQSLPSPFGLGMGTIRETLAQGRTALAGDHLLEWPHNEFIRFFVDGGIIGLLTLGTLVIWVTSRTAHAVSATSNATRNGLMIAITADMLAQCLVQNYLNSVYYATLMLTLLSILWVRAHEEASTSERAPPEAPFENGTVHGPMAWSR